MFGGGHWHNGKEEKSGRKKGWAYLGLWWSLHLEFLMDKFKSFKKKLRRSLPVLALDLNGKEREDITSLNRAGGEEFHSS